MQLVFQGTFFVPEGVFRAVTHPAPERPVCINLQITLTVLIKIMEIRGLELYLLGLKSVKNDEDELAAGSCIESLA